MAGKGGGLRNGRELGAFADAVAEVFDGGGAGGGGVAEECGGYV